MPQLVMPCYGASALLRAAAAPAAALPLCMQRHLVICKTQSCMPLHLCACVQDEDDTSSLSELLGTGRGRATVAAELLALMAMSPFLVSPREQGGGWGHGGAGDGGGGEQGAQGTGDRHCLGSASSNMEPLPQP